MGPPASDLPHVILVTESCILAQQGDADRTPGIILAPFRGLNCLSAAALCIPAYPQENLYTPVVGQLGTVETLTVLGHVYVAGYVAFGYGLEEDGISIASITVTDSVDIMMNLDPDGDGIFGAPHHVLAAPLRMRATPGNPTRHHRPTL